MKWFLTIANEEDNSQLSMNARHRSRNRGTIFDIKLQGTRRKRRMAELGEERFGDSFSKCSLPWKIKILVTSTGRTHNGKKRYSEVSSSEIQEMQSVAPSSPTLMIQRRTLQKIIMNSKKCKMATEEAVRTSSRRHGSTFSRRSKRPPSRPWWRPSRALPPLHVHYNLESKNIKDN